MLARRHYNAWPQRVALKVMPIGSGKLSGNVSKREIFKPLSLWRRLRHYPFQRPGQALPYKVPGQARLTCQA
jgi:hypothetical protein